MSNKTDAAASAAAEPWWRVKMVWLVIGGPAAVVVASLATSVLAVRGGDTVVGAEPDETPAMQARNHAATPKKP